MKLQEKKSAMTSTVNGINAESTAWHHIRELSLIYPVIHTGLMIGKVNGWSNELTLANMVLTMNSMIAEQQKELIRIHETSIVQIVKLKDLQDEKQEQDA